MLKPRVEVQSENGILVAEFWDCLRLDPGAVQDLRQRYDAHLKGGGRAEVVVDLIGVSFAGSASLGHFVSLHRAARAKMGRLVFCNVDPTVFEVFRVSKLDPLFSFVSDRAAALTQAAGPEQTVGSSVASSTSSTVVEGGKTVAEPPKSAGGNLLRSSRRRNLS